MLPVALLSNWKLIGAGVMVAAFLGFAGCQHLKIRSLRGDLQESHERVGELETTVAAARHANESNQQTIAALKGANEAFEEITRVNAEKLAQLEQGAQLARDDAARVRRDLDARRRRDDEVPACAALLDQSLSVCPDVVQRLKEREQALRK